MSLLKNRAAQRKNNRLPFQSINWAVTSKCNYSCKFCFGHYPQHSTEIATNLGYQLIDSCIDLGCKKLTFEGGEPFLHASLINYLKYAKAMGLTTMTISNGSLLNLAILNKISPYLDWLGISIDSNFNETERLLGRTCFRMKNHVTHAKHILREAKRLGIQIKVNVVVTSLNIDEDFHTFLREIQPDRIKFLQVLPIFNIPGTQGFSLHVTDKQFEGFQRRHGDLCQEFPCVFESNDLMYDSYVMLAPDGHFVKNTGGVYEFSTDPVYKMSEKKVKEFCEWDYAKFIVRKGDYLAKAQNRQNY